MQSINIARLFQVVSWRKLQSRDMDIELVDPLIGTDSCYELSNGNTFPAAALPFGAVHWSPQTGSGEWIYQYRAKTLQGLRLTHCPSVWMGDYGSFVIAALTGAVPATLEEGASRFSHAEEVAKPYAYKARLRDRGSAMEVVPTMRGGLLRFTFQRSGRPLVVLRVHPGAL